MRASFGNTRLSHYNLKSEINNKCDENLRKKYIFWGSFKGPLKQKVLRANNFEKKKFNALG